MIANTAIAGLFVGSFALLALCYPSCRAALWFSASYAVGLLTPLSEYLLPISPWPDLFRVLSYVSFFTSLESAALALAICLGQRPPFVSSLIVFLFAMLIRYAIWNGVRDTLPYEFAYQLPFACASTLSIIVIICYKPKQLIHRALVGCFTLLTALFLTKPFLAAHFGSGITAKDYTASTYALVSQASTGVILIAIGLVLLIMVFQGAIAEAVAASETDILTGLINRRGFDRLAAAALTRPRLKSGGVLMIDIDHFKRVNDVHGHAVGDEVLRAFAANLTETIPPSALCARVGGEEFAVFLDGADIQAAKLVAENLRLNVSKSDFRSTPPFTISVGVTELTASDQLRDVMRRADQALYQAKKIGRDKVVVREPNYLRIDPARQSSLAMQNGKAQFPD